MEQEKFVAISALLCEPARAKMLWNLLDGRAYTAGELALVADISPTSASNHLSRLLEAELLKVELQGRHRYFSFAKPEVAYVVESLANLSNPGTDKRQNGSKPTGIKYCRSCYDHLAGLAGVTMTEAMERMKLISKEGPNYTISNNGWKWLGNLGISKDEITISRRPVARQCLDWSERRPHLAGQLGAVLLSQMLKQNWFRQVKFSRELIITPKGRQEFYKLLRVEV